MNYHPKHIKHKNYKPESWSQQARRLADRIYKNCLGEDSWTHEQARHFFSTSYRCDLIKNRAAKRFGRKWRKEHKSKM